MKHYCSFLALAALALLSLPTHAQITAPPNAINFQGRLATPSGNPVFNGTYSIRFRFYDALAAGNVVYEPPLASVLVTNGTFAVTISGFTADTFNGNTWLGIKVGNDAELAPRTQIVSVPYAIKSTLALTVPDASITNAKLAGGITNDKFASGTFNGLAWLLGGNSGINPASNFLGTTDNQPLVFKVNGTRAMQYQAVGGAINVLGGSDANSIERAVGSPIGVTIAGGGSAGGGNIVKVNFSTIGGGKGNQILDLGALAGCSTIAGGSGNSAGSDVATVGGGSGNQAFGAYSAIPGGRDNSANGDYSIALGRQANVRAADAGTFVWADQGDPVNGTAFTSTGIDQFLIRATGGVGINKNNPSTALDVAGTATMTGFSLPTGAATGRALLSDASGLGTWGLLTNSGIAAGTITADRLASGTLNPLAWLLGGNSGTNPASHFLGTTDNQPLIFKVNGQQSVRLQYKQATVAANNYTGISILSGSPANVLGPNAVGSLVAGGATVNSTALFNTVNGLLSIVAGGHGNAANGDHSTVSGGQGNLATGDYTIIGGGNTNQIEAPYSVIAGGTGNYIRSTAPQYATIAGGNGNLTWAFASVIGGGNSNLIGKSTDAGGIPGSVIAGGFRNQAYGVYGFIGGGQANVTGIASGRADYATIAGGIQNKAQGDNSFVGGGNGNTASGVGSSVGGGSNNTASAGSAVVPGGSNNTAAGQFSFAAGNRAKANHDGTFVWGDNTAADFVSTGVNQFLIRASGGAGFNTADIQDTLTVNGGMTLDRYGFNNGTLSFLPAGFGLRFGPNAEAGIASKRTTGGNEKGLDFYTASINRLAITYAGRVGIGKTDPAYTLDVFGNINASGNVLANGVILSSDRRYKKNIAPLENPLDSLLLLRGVSYEWDRTNWKERGFEEGRQYGFIAQEVEQIFPDFVHTDASGYKSVNYIGVLPVLVEAVKAQQKQINAMEKQNTRIGELEAQLAALTQTLREMKAAQDGAKSVSK